MATSSNRASGGLSAKGTAHSHTVGCQQRPRATSWTGSTRPSRRGSAARTCTATCPRGPPMGDTTKIYAGQVVERDRYEAQDVIFLGDDDEPLAEIIETDLEEFGKNVSVSYFVSEQPRTKEQLEDNLIRKLLGDLEAD